MPNDYLESLDKDDVGNYKVTLDYPQLFPLYLATTSYPYSPLLIFSLKKAKNLETRRKMECEKDMQVRLLKDAGFAFIGFIGSAKKSTFPSSRRLSS